MYCLFDVPFICLLYLATFFDDCSYWSLAPPNPPPQSSYGKSASGSSSSKSSYASKRASYCFSYFAFIDNENSISAIIDAFIEYDPFGQKEFLGGHEFGVIPFLFNCLKDGLLIQNYHIQIPQIMASRR